ncbi:MAG: hypothetical protein A2908_02435 [Candidatus Staskawiczbacteria bacterium RIFCSPLOWO2_01_FULL_38_12b]|uniref:Uncharacterized protein n=1 Tax=Candidatus Staskawiczbacteria bacterium RIFCSPLOWO2_01_FULL_38_12b TaxID=1802214 RepID=A0A1G2IF67_9BACT|nr:MAG: hypothetical protein A2908_02435 [Candidatus Staskawiczbacteria bacterium RIFCSPLOWO2_01_FULL_38_12b]
MTGGILEGLNIGGKKEALKPPRKPKATQEEAPGKKINRVILPPPSIPSGHSTNTEKLSQLRKKLIGLLGDEPTDNRKPSRPASQPSNQESLIIRPGTGTIESTDPADRLSDLGRELEKLSRFNPFAILKRKALQTEMEVLQRQVEAEESPLLGEKPERIEILQSQIPIVPPIDIEKIIIKPKTPEPEKARGGVEIEEPAWVIKKKERIQALKEELARRAQE